MVDVLLISILPGSKYSFKGNRLRDFVWSVISTSPSQGLREVCSISGSVYAHLYPRSNFKAAMCSIFNSLSPLRNLHRRPSKSSGWSCPGLLYLYLPSVLAGSCDFPSSRKAPRASLSWNVWTNFCLDLFAIQWRGSGLRKTCSPFGYWRNGKSLI